ncbi:MAG: response regulator [Alphaproteobacteria bacterium]
MAGEIVLAADDDETTREILTSLLAEGGYTAFVFPSGEALLNSPLLDEASCVITDMRMPGLDGLALIAELARTNRRLPIIVITGHGDILGAVRAMKAGAFDYMEKPISKTPFFESVGGGVAAGVKARELNGNIQTVRESYERLTAREREILALLVAGKPNKEIAHDLDISPRTVETHRASLMSKMGASGAAHLVRMAVMYDSNLLNAQPPQAPDL